VKTNKLILGTVQLGMDYGINNLDGKPSAELALDILKATEKYGIETLDTAEAYGESHQIINKAILSGLKFKIGSKIQKLNRDGKKQVDDILEELGISELDSLSFHSLASLEKVDKTKALEALYQDKRIHKLGVSVYGNEELEKAINIEGIKLIQLPFNLLDNWSVRGSLISKAKDKGIEIHTRSSFLQGLFFLEEEKFKGSIEALLGPIRELKMLAERSKLSIAELALRYSISFPEIDKVVFGVDKLEQLESNIEVFNKGCLEKEVLDNVNKILVLDQDLLNPGLWK
jgi:aryl-alcohol dehydrogenase-like predicted oxidoreductase